jgi:hypothetical protein
LAVIEELGDMLSLDDGQLSTINGQLFTINGVPANGSHPGPSPTRSSPTRPGISDDKEHDMADSSADQKTMIHVNNDEHGRVDPSGHGQW